MSAAVTETAMSPAEQVAARIIGDQTRVVGKAAFKLATRVKGLSVARGSGTPRIDAPDVGRVLDDLVHEYSAITGAVGIRMCFMAAATILRDHPELDVPAFRPFRRLG